MVFITTVTHYYRKETGAYWYNGDEKPNHDVVIIGWDDDYPKEKFASAPESDGAFLCINSWGETFGDGGFFHVSYEDSRIAEVLANAPTLELAGDALLQLALDGGGRDNITIALFTLGKKQGA